MDPSTSAAAPHSADPQQAFAAVMREIDSLGTVDPATRQKLLDDLSRIDPALWPLLVQSFRASLAYRQESGAAAPPPAVAPPGNSPIVQGAPPMPFGPPAATAQAAAPPIRSPAPVVATPSAAARGPYSTSAAAERPADVLNASYEGTVPADDWHGHLALAIVHLENGIDDPGPANDDRLARLRLLYLAAGRRDDAIRPQTAAPLAEQEFWSEALFGLSTYLDAAALPDPGRRSAEAARHLHAAAAHLGTRSILAVRNLQFCTEVKSYGVFTPVAKTEFAPGEKVLLYWEVENFHSESTPQGFHTALKSSYQLFDAQGRRVDEQAFPFTEERCQNCRRDFFVRYYLWLPAQIAAGKHTLQLTVEDTLGHKIGQAAVDLAIRGR